MKTKIFGYKREKNKFKPTKLGATYKVSFIEKITGSRDFPLFLF